MEQRKSKKAQSQKKESKKQVITRNRVIVFVLIICITVTSILVGCGAKKNDEPVESYDFSVFLGSLDEPIEIDAMLTEYEEKTGLKIEPIVIPENKDNKGTLESLLNDGAPPAIYAVASDIEEDWLSKGGFIADFSNLDSEGKGQSVPYFMDGYGLAYDRAMFEEMFGEKDGAALISDLRVCGYEEWKVFVHALNDYINDRDARSFTVNKHDYKFPDKKKELTQNLNGVFAFPGANSEIYGDSLMNLITQHEDLSTWEAVKMLSSESALHILEPSITTYINSVDFMTSYLAGRYSAGIRGSDFTDEEYYSNYLTDRMFMSGKAMFSIIDSTKYSEIKTLNAKKAVTLEYLPIKMAYDDSYNTSIPANVSYSLYINKKLPEDVQKKAYDFLMWFTDKEELWSDPLSLSIKSYVNTGNILEYNQSPEEIKAWKEDIFGEKGMESFLKKELWTDEYKSNIKLFMTEKWIEN